MVQGIWKILILCFFLQVYSLVQILSILSQELQEGILLASPNQTSPTPAYGSVLQPPGMEREELRVYNYLLLLVFIIVIFTCFLLVIGICKVNLVAVIIKFYVTSFFRAFNICLSPGLSPPSSPSSQSLPFIFTSYNIKRLENKIQIKKEDFYFFIFRHNLLQWQLLY